MNSETLFRQEFSIKGGDFINAGEASVKIRNILKEIGIDANIVRRVAIASYEAEMNVVMFANDGVMCLSVTPDKISLTVSDNGQGIADIDQAMHPGFSTATDEMREMGFGAGMGLPNMKKNADVFRINSTVGKGTDIEIVVNLDGNIND